MINITHETLNDKLKASGIDNDLFRLNKRWTALKIFFSDESHWYWVRKSRRGWFLGDKEVFSVPESTNILDVCIAWANKLESRSNRIHTFGLELQSSWIGDEFASEQKIWKSAGWHLLSDSETMMIFDKMEVLFPFSNNRFTPPPQALFLDFSSLYECNLLDFEDFSSPLNYASLLSLRRCMLDSEDIIAIDWNQSCYRLEAGSSLNTGASEMWPISVFPEGDFHMFMATDFRLGIISNSDGMICVFGDQMPEVLAEKIGKTTLKT